MVWVAAFVRISSPIFFESLRTVKLRFDLRQCWNQATSVLLSAHSYAYLERKLTDSQVSPVGGMEMSDGTGIEPRLPAGTYGMCKVPLWIILDDLGMQFVSRVNNHPLLEGGPVAVTMLTLE